MTDNSHRHTPGRILPLCLAALGVVYGDIGTSPLYAIRECFHGPHAIPVSHDNVLGVLSLIFWSLVVVISVKYLALVLRADNEGEGGILALMALVLPNGNGQAWWRRGLLLTMGLFGAALLYGDGMITPAISVLSAVEGLEVATPAFTPYVVPLTVVLLVALFALQHKGTAAVGRAFGPVMLLWFSCLTALGAVEIARNPRVLAAMSPLFAGRFFMAHGWHGLMILGVVFLVVTGGEALYADMGHFGRRPIRLAWFAVVLPALLTNYFGQGALILRQPGAVVNPFYHLAPSWALYPLVVLAAVATVVASQAVITGAFSLTMQAVQLGYLPRIHVRHTSAHQFGQIYVPVVNWLLLLSTVGLVLGFGSSSGMAAAYGVAITTTMVITTLLAFFAMRDNWRWSLPAAGSITAVLLAIDLSFFSANIVKVADGGWFPLAVGAGVLLVMTTWRKGRTILAIRLGQQRVTFEDLFRRIDAESPARVPGVEVHLYSNPAGVPQTLLRNLHHNRVLHQDVIVVTVVPQRIPVVPEEQRVALDHLRSGFHRVTIRYGFMEDPDVPLALGKCAGLPATARDHDSVTYILGRETLLAAHRPGMAPWRGQLFALLSRNAARATTFFHIPPDRVLEIGAQIEI